MKKFTALILLFITVLCFCACKNTSSETSSYIKKPNSIKQDIINSKVDIDLTKLNDEDLAKKIDEINRFPEKYLGKAIRIKGLFFSSYDLKSNENNYFIIGKNSTDDEPWKIKISSSKENFVYPENTAKIEIIGTFSKLVRNYYIEIDTLNVIS